VKLKSPGTVDAAIDALEDLVQKASNIMSSWAGMERGKEDYLRWIEVLEANLDNYFEDSELLDGVRTDVYWHIYRLMPSDPRPYPTIERELNVQKARLDKVIARLRALKPLIERQGGIVMPDTSVFLEGQYFKDVDWATAAAPLGTPTRIIVAGLVIEELEKIKTFERGNRQGRARQVLKDLRELLIDKPDRPAQFRPGVTIEVFLDDDWHERMLNNDGEIIDQAVQVQRLTGRMVAIACLDLPMELRARLRGLLTMTVPGKADAHTTVAGTNDVLPATSTT
jgi:hypothetical protein